MKIDLTISAESLLPQITRLLELSAQKILNLEKAWDPGAGAPVFTRQGHYVSRQWTEWTQGFQFGSALIQFDVTGQKEFLRIGREHTVRHMAAHVSHVGVHDHGFNNISTYGNLWRLIRDGRIESNSDKDLCELALKVSGAIQAARWTALVDGRGFIYSFNGPHSLFIDTLRSLRSLALAHELGHVLMGEQDQRISLLDRLMQHAAVSAEYAVYYGEGRDAYDVPGRVAHESLFNVNSGKYRCPNSQQGYSPFSTWTRGLAWALTGYGEQLEYLAQAQVESRAAEAERVKTIDVALRAATAVAEFYIKNTPVCGVPMWDTGAPNLHRLADYLDEPADPYNSWEPVDSSAAAIAGQGFLRLGNYLARRGKKKLGTRYRQAAFTIARAIFSEPYLSLSPKHQGLVLHSVYHRPGGWDYVAPGQKVPNGESSMWGDYHARELGLMLWREAKGQPYMTFFGRGGIDIAEASTGETKRCMSRLTNQAAGY